MDAMISKGAEIAAVVDDPGEGSSLTGIPEEPINVGGA
jgi:hypothetical protein